VVRGEALCACLLRGRTGAALTPPRPKFAPACVRAANSETRAAKQAELAARRRAAQMTQAEIARAQSNASQSVRRRGPSQQTSGSPRSPVARVLSARKTAPPCVQAAVANTAWPPAGTTQAENCVVQ
jgi:hypothetical protein